MFRPPLLISFPYFNPEIVAVLRERKGDYRLMVDSGAFTAWKSGKPESLDAYCRFLESIDDLRPFHAIQLDVIGDPVATAGNFVEMRRRGFDVMPVFTRGETPARLEELYAQTDYVLLGGVATGRGNRAYVNAFMRMNRGRKVHLLGFTDIQHLKTHRPTSADSSSWARAERWGILSVYMGSGASVAVHREKFVKQPDHSIVEALMRSGVTPPQIANLARQAAWKNTRRLIAGELGYLAAHVQIMSALSLASEVERNMRTVYYLAFGSQSQLQAVFDGIEQWNANSIYAEVWKQ